MPETGTQKIPRLLLMPARQLDRRGLHQTDRAADFLFGLPI